MNDVDVILLVVLLVYAIAGYLRGFMSGFASLVGLVFTIGGSWLLYPEVAAALSGRVTPASAPAAAFLGLVAGLSLTWAITWRTVYRAIPKSARGAHVNHLLGIVPGLVDGIIMAALGLTILVTLPTDRIPRDAIDDSKIGGVLLSVGSDVQARALDVFGGAMRSFAQIHTEEPKEGERVRLPFHTSKGVSDPEMERRMFGMVNLERTSCGLNPLKWDDRLRVVAREHSEDMLRRGYFSHYSPEGKTVMDRLTAHGLHFEMVGENLALAPTLKMAHDGLMQSPGHRANILRRGFARIGIGALVARPYGIMFTQVFAK